MAPTRSTTPTTSATPRAQHPHGGWADCRCTHGSPPSARCHEYPQCSPLPPIPCRAWRQPSTSVNASCSKQLLAVEYCSSQRRRARVWSGGLRTRRDVHAATEEAIDALTELDLARERPELADELTDLVTAAVDPRVVPPSLDSRHRTLLERSLRLAAICELALADDGASATALQAERRTRVLRPLLTTARYGVAAATEWWGPRSSS